jgi:hypothetical protein
VRVYLFIGLTRFPVFSNDQALYMAALVFSAYGIIGSRWAGTGFRAQTPREAHQMALYRLRQATHYRHTFDRRTCMRGKPGAGTRRVAASGSLLITDVEVQAAACRDRVHQGL